MSTRCNIEFYGVSGEGKIDRSPDARIYQHGDGYPEGQHGIIERLKELATKLGAGIPLYGARLDDPEWAAAEFISQFRSKLGGNIYVSQKVHPDIDYIYRVECHTRMWKIKVFKQRGDRFIAMFTLSFDPSKPEAA